MAGRNDSSSLMEEVLTIRMHTKVTSGGRNLNFAALVAIGNGKGRIGLGYGKAPGVPQAIEKANKRARESMFEVPLIGDTLSHEQIGEHKSSRVLLKPAAPGTGAKAGGTVRAILLVLGVHNVLTKSLGRNNPINLAQATIDGLKKMRLPGEVEELRNKKIVVKHPQWELSRKAEKLEEEETKKEETAKDLNNEGEDVPVDDDAPEEAVNKNPEAKADKTEKEEAETELETKAASDDDDEAKPTERSEENGN